MILANLLKKLFIVCIFAIPIISFLRCDFLNMEYIPEAGQLRANHSTFLIDDSNLQGVYANQDVDSVLFKYMSTAKNEEAFWANLNMNAQAGGWKHVEQQDTFCRYERIIARPGQYSSAEDVRVAYNKKTRGVVVVWVQADESDVPKTFADTSESKWAERVIWPKFKKLINQ